MARDADRRVEHYRAGRAREQAGLPSWALTIRIGPALEDRNMAFPARRDAIVADVRASRWSDVAADPKELDEILKAMSRSTSPKKFAEYFRELKEMANDDRVWFGE